MFQSVHDRVSAKRYDGAHIVDGAFERELWALKHARLHPQWQHDDFKRSGLFVTPAAAERLVPFGIIPVQDIVESVESAHAGLLAPRAPIDDAETSLKVLR